MRHEVESLRPPSPEVICCLAGFLGESRDSGLGLGLDAMADNVISSGASRTIRGKSMDPLPFSRSGLITGDFQRHRVPQGPVLRHGPKITKWVNFFRTCFLSEPDLWLFP